MNWAAIAVIIDSIVTVAVGIKLNQTAKKQIGAAGEQLVKDAPQILAEALRSSGGEQDA